MANDLHNQDLPPAGGFPPSQQALRIQAAQAAEDAAAADGVPFDSDAEPTTVARYQAAQAALEVDRIEQAQASVSGIVTTNISTKVQEGAAAMLSTFNGTGQFVKMAATAKTFGQYAATAIQAGVNGILGKKDPLNTAAVVGAVSLTNVGIGPSARDVNATINRKKVEDRSHMVSLTSKQTGAMVEFEVMPEVVENRDVEYEAIAPAQFPGAFQKYKGTSSVVWNINATLVSRTSDEATQNLNYLNTLRGWTLPYFGENTRLAYPDKLGAPPDVLILRGFRKGMVGPVPVVIKALNWTFPRDVDYIPTNSVGGEAATPFPTVLQLSINLVESFSTTEFNQFDLAQYRSGDLSEAFSKVLPQPLPPQSGGRGYINPPTAAEIAANQTALPTVTAAKKAITEKTTAYVRTPMGPPRNGTGRFGG